MSYPVVIIGAGVGGLAASVALAAGGLDVLVLESAAQPGGKLREVSIGSHRLDAGPTVFTMRWVFDELFAQAGESLDALLTLQPAGLLARHAWNDSERLDLFADVARSAEAIAAFAGPAEGRRYREFCERARRIYDTLEAPFLRGSRPDPIGLARRIGLRRLPDLMGISPFTTLWKALGEHFHDPRLRQLFGRYATYCGSSPFDAPATLMLVAHVEREGVWLVEGGMHRIAQALADASIRHGARIRYGATVEQVLLTAGRAGGVRLRGGESIDATAVVFNGDVSAFGAGLLGPAVAAAVPAVPRAKRSLSAVTWNVVGATQGFPLVRHNVFFSPRYEAEFDDVFARRRVPANPTVYVCAQDRDDAGAGAEDATGAAAPERLLCLINAPADGDVADPSSMEIEQCEQRMQQTLARCGLKIEADPAHTVMTTPTDFARLFPATGGALYGQASHGWMASFARPGSRTKIPGLYLTGGSTHPGPGVPMAALSGRLAAQSLLQDLRRDSTSTWRLAATPGGTLTRSATTGNTR